MRILLVHNEYGKPSGEEHALQALAAILTRNGHQANWFLRSSAELDSMSGKIKGFFSGIYNPYSRRSLGAVLREELYDLVLVQNLYPLLSPSVLAACKRFNVPVVMRCPNYRIFCPNSLHLSHGEVCERCLGGREYWCVLRNCERDYAKSVGYALRNAFARLTHGIVPNVSLFIVLSEFQRQRFIRGGIPAERLEILPNVVPQVNGISTTSAEDLITFVGRASPEKGIEDFVDAARALSSLPFAVAGDATRMPGLVAASPPNVRWLGFLPEQELNQVYGQSRLLVFPFRWFEGFPNVITRAMALKKPVVAARIGAVPEIVEDGRTGLLFETKNVPDLIAKIQTLYPDPVRCREMGRAGHAKALSTYSSEVVYRRLMQICQRSLLVN